MERVCETSPFPAKIPAENVSHASSAPLALTTDRGDR